MACPYFRPTARLETNSWIVPPRLPLGDAFTGECRADAGAFQPDEARLRQCCNVGYGRAACERFPRGAKHDAVRFHIANDAGGLIRIQYVFEEACWPREHGILMCSAATREMTGADDAILKSQAAAFVESYLRRRA
jgi:hypothetical protein